MHNRDRKTLNSKWLLRWLTNGEFDLLRLAIRSNISIIHCPLPIAILILRFHAEFAAESDDTQATSENRSEVAAPPQATAVRFLPPIELVFADFLVFADLQ